MAYQQNIDERARSVRTRTGRRSVQTRPEPEAKTGDCLCRSRKPAVFPKTAGTPLTGRSGRKTWSIRRSPVFKITGRRITAGRSNAPAISASRLPFPAGKQLRTAENRRGIRRFPDGTPPRNHRNGKSGHKKSRPGRLPGSFPWRNHENPSCNAASFSGGKLLLKSGKGGEAPPGKRAAPQAGERAFPVRNPARFPAADKACFSCAVRGGRIGRSSDRPIRKRRFYLIAIILTFISPPGV